MSAFEILLQKIKRETFSEDKKNRAKDFIRNWVSSSEVARIVKCFPSSSDQLEVAKFGYNHVTDTRNYFLVADALSSSIDRNELKSFIRRQTSY